VSGGSRECRAELATIIEFLPEGDEVVVTRLDQLDSFKSKNARVIYNILKWSNKLGQRELEFSGF